MSNDNETNKPENQAPSPEENKPAAKAGPGESSEGGSSAPGGKQAAPAAADKPAPVKKEAPPPPPPPEPGKYAQLLSKKGLSPVALVKDAGNVETFQLKANELYKGCEILKNEGQFDLLVSISGVDWPTRGAERLEVVYHLYSTKTFEKLVVKATAVDEKVPSVTPLWPGANWHERETYDLYGITFEGHPNLKRILMPVDWIGYPMRKDYKVEDPRLVWNER